jgi:acyl-CoA dehydrogenase
MFQEYFNEDHQIFRGTVRKFVEKEIMPNIEHWEDAEIFPVELYARAAGAGLMGLDFPEAYGGIPCDKFMHVPLHWRSAAAGPSASSRDREASHRLPPILHMGNGKSEAALPGTVPPRDRRSPPGDHGSRRRVRRGENRPRPSATGSLCP